MAEVVSQVHALESNIAFLERDAKHKQEKPYKLQYDPGLDSQIPRTNVVSKHYGPITVHDFRDLEETITFEKNGFCALDMQSKMSPEDFYDEDKVKRIYYPELQALILEKFKATRVEVLEHLVGRPPKSRPKPGVSRSFTDQMLGSKASRRIPYIYWRGL